MDKIAALKKEIDYWKKQEEAKKLIEKSKQQCELKYSEIAKAYQDFYTSKINKEFVLYDRYPSVDALRIYLRRVSDKFPLHDYGTLNIKELAEIIKHIYQFKTGKEYQILTVGTTECDSIFDHGWEFSSVKPHLYLMVGNAKTLEPYQEYNGKFVNSHKLYLDISLHAKGKDLINIEASREYNNSIAIECLTGHESDKNGCINYFDKVRERYMRFSASSCKQVFSNNIRSFAGKGIKDVFDFNIHLFDTYIAKVLISVIIYKKNNNIQELSNDDYNHIFDILFGEKVDIVEDSKKDIPKQLIYVPDEKNGL